MNQMSNPNKRKRNNRNQGGKGGAKMKDKQKDERWIDVARSPQTIGKIQTKQQSMVHQTKASRSR